MKQRSPQMEPWFDEHEAEAVYAYMQSVGLVNDHVLSCFRHPELA